jgi:lipid-A-disaccharide synthase-like uncharacterized protein
LKYLLVFFNDLPLRDVLIYSLGFLAQSLFGARIIVQWYKSEREGRVVSPTLFWIFSLCGSFLFLIYGLLRKDPVILLGQTLSFYIYIRNLQLKKFWTKIPLAWRVIITPLPFILYLVMILTTPDSFQDIFKNLNYTDSVLVIGGVGQLLLNLRYLYQWYYSEQANESLLPLGFWLISAVASVMVVYYGFNRLDPVLLTAQSMGFVAYLRNIYLSLSGRFKTTASK